MPEWLQTSLTNGTETTPMVLAWRVGMALMLGVAVSGIYRWARRGEPIPATFLTTLILLSTLIAMATQIIGDNVARAFSLVGALSVVRFRTVVKDTQDTAFVIFAVVVGMAAGSNHLLVGLIGLAILAVASLLMWPRSLANHWRTSESRLTLRIALSEGVQEATTLFLTNATLRHTLTSIATAKKGGSLDLTYRILLHPDFSPAMLITEMNRIEGVECVELHRGE